MSAEGILMKVMMELQSLLEAVSLQNQRITINLHIIGLNALLVPWKKECRKYVIQHESHTELEEN